MTRLEVVPSLPSAILYRVHVRPELPSLVKDQQNSEYPYSPQSIDNTQSVLLNFIDLLIGGVCNIILAVYIYIDSIIYVYIFIYIYLLY